MLPSNAKIHSQEHIDKIVKSIKEFGFKQPILITTDNFIIAGHGRITQDEYDKKAYELKQRQYELNQKQKQLTQADESFAITVSYLLDLSARAYQLFESSKIEQKRQLINFVFSNLKLRGKTLEFELKKPFEVILDANVHSNWLPLVDTFRTFYFNGMIAFNHEFSEIVKNFL